MRIGFLINPIAGMGGRVGLKGTDGVADEAIRLGAQPVSPHRAGRALRTFAALSSRASPNRQIDWLTCAGSMGMEALLEAGLASAEIVYRPGSTTTPDDTKDAVRCMVAAKADLILFCGGDGTARDICEVVGDRLPILGIPAGVKMFSGVFGVTPERTAEILAGFVDGKLLPTSVDVLDLDEERYRQGEWAVRLHHSASTPYEPAYTQSAKLLVAEATDSEVKDEIAAYMCEEISKCPDRLFLLGPGSTVHRVGEQLGLDTSLLGIDAVVGGKVIGRDLDEAGILALLERHSEVRLVLSPIGAQGFVLGRGNQQLTADIIRGIGSAGLIVIATPSKLARTPVLRFDTGARELDAHLTKAGFMPVVTGHRRRRLVRVAA